MIKDIFLVNSDKKVLLGRKYNISGLEFPIEKKLDHQIAYLPINNIYLCAIFKNSLPEQIICTLKNIAKEFPGEINQKSVKKDFFKLFEILEEFKVKLRIKEDTNQIQLYNFQDPIRNSRNEVFLDIKEKIVCVSNTNSKVYRCFVSGTILTRSNLNKTSDFKMYLQTKNVSFLTTNLIEKTKDNILISKIFPNKNTLSEYLIYNNEPPILVIKSNEGYKLKANTFFDEIVVYFPLPNSTFQLEYKSNFGFIEQKDNILIWTLIKLQKSEQFIDIRCNALENETLKSINVKFRSRSPQFKIKSMVFTDKTIKCYAKYESISGSYEIRQGN